MTGTMFVSLTDRTGLSQDQKRWLSGRAGRTGSSHDYVYLGQAGQDSLWTGSFCSRQEKTFNCACPKKDSFVWRVRATRLLLCQQGRGQRKKNLFNFWLGRRNGFRLKRRPEW